MATEAPPERTTSIPSCRKWAWTKAPTSACDISRIGFKRAFPSAPRPSPLAAPRPSPIQEQSVSLALGIELQGLVEQGDQLAQEWVAWVENIEPCPTRSAPSQDPGEFQTVELLLDLYQICFIKPRDLARIAFIPGTEG